jgi:high affinity sulfate transporter 1
MHLAPPWLTSYRRGYVRPDALAGLTVWSIVVPQAVAYAQIAGLPPQAGLLAAPGALIGYALLGTSRSLVVGATSSTAALSAATVGSLAHGNAAAFAALSAALALIVAGVFVLAGLMRFGGVADLISKPILTGFLFGLGLTIAVGQLPKLLGVPSGSGNFFPKLFDLLGDLGDTSGATLAVGVVSVAALLALRSRAPSLPSSLIVLVASIAVSAAAGLSDHGVAVVGHIPSAFPSPQLPDVDGDQLAAMVGGAIGIALVGYAEAITVGRSTAARHGYAVKPDRELIGLGGANLLAGLSQGFAQSGGASQTAAADRAGGKTQATSLVAAALVLVTGALLAPLFTDLPEATLGAIVIVAILGFLNVEEIARMARLRRSALLLSSLALVGVLVLGILNGLVLAVALSLAFVVQRLSRPGVVELGREPVSGDLGMLEEAGDRELVPGVLMVRVEGQLFYANANAVKERVLARVDAEQRDVHEVLVDLIGSIDLDVETLDMLADLRDGLAAHELELRFIHTRSKVRAALGRRGLGELVVSSLDASEPPTSPERPRRPPATSAPRSG